MPTQLTKGYVSFLFSAWGYARRKRLGTAALDSCLLLFKIYEFVNNVDVVNVCKWIFLHINGQKEYFRNLYNHEKTFLMPCASF